MKLIQNQWQPKKIEVDISQFSINTMHADHLYEGVAFSSAAGIVRGANPMPSHLLSVRLSGINLFSNQILPHFSCDLYNIWLECAQQYCPKTCGIRILILLILIFKWIFYYKKIGKNWDFWRFGAFSQKFLIWNHETWFTSLLWILSGVCEKWPLWAKFSGLFWPQIGPK